MREIKVDFNVPEQDHHEFYYKEGKKIPIPDDGVRYMYIDRGGLLHCTKWEDDASQYGGGVYMAVDSAEGIGGKNGVPEIDGETYYIWDAGSNWVRTGKDTREKFYTKAKEGAKKVVTHPNSEAKAEACEILRQIYNDIEDRLREVSEEMEKE